MSDKLLDIEDLRTYFHLKDGLLRAVDGVSFYIKKGETVGLVGESGCGKTVTALSILRLIENPPGEIISGAIYFEGDDLLKLSLPKMRHVRGNKISMIFQEPMSCLNPVFSVGRQIGEVFRLHQNSSRSESIEKAIEILEPVGIPLPEYRVKQYPHELSGGMCQRVMIATALACRPKLLLADEPTTALDVTIQAQILELLKELRRDYKMAILLITHDLGVVAEVADRIIVMYSGKIMEVSDVLPFFRRPQHPYSIGLLSSVPKIEEEVARLKVIEGVVPNLTEEIRGCKFSSRCSLATEKCFSEEPPLFETEQDRFVRCWNME